MSKHSNPVENFIIRYNFVILTVVVSLVLASSIYLSYTAFISAASPNEVDVQSSIPTNFNQDTIDRIDELHTSSEAKPEDAKPNGRSNPFAE